MIKHISANSKLTEYKRTPLTELSGTNRINTITDTDNRIKIIECRIVILAIRSSCFHFGNNWMFVQLTTLKYIFKMLADCRHSHIKKLRYSLLCSPNCLTFIHHLNPILFAFKHEDEKLSRAISYHYILRHNFKIFLSIT